MDREPGRARRDRRRHHRLDGQRGSRRAGGGAWPRGGAIRPDGEAHPGCRHSPGRHRGDPDDSTGTVAHRAARARLGCAPDLHPQRAGRGAHQPGVHGSRRARARCRRPTPGRSGQGCHRGDRQAGGAHHPDRVSGGRDEIQPSGIHRRSGRGNRDRVLQSRSDATQPGGHGAGRTRDGRAQSRGDGQGSGRLREELRPGHSRGALLHPPDQHRRDRQAALHGSDPHRLLSVCVHIPGALAHDEWPDVMWCGPGRRCQGDSAFVSICF